MHHKSTLKSLHLYDYFYSVRAFSLMVLSGFFTMLVDFFYKVNLFIVRVKIEFYDDDNNLVDSIYVYDISIEAVNVGKSKCFFNYDIVEGDIERYSIKE